MITASQIRAARAAVGWSAEELAKNSDLVRRTIVKIEASDGVPSSNARSLQKIQIALESVGVEFIGTPDDGPGIRIHRRPAP